MWLAKVHLGCSLIDCQVLPALATWQLVPMQPGRKIADNHSRRGTNNHTAWETNNNTSSGWIIKALGVVHVYFHADVVRGQPMIRMGKPSIITLARSILTAGYYSPTCCRHSQKKLELKQVPSKGLKTKKTWLGCKKEKELTEGRLIREWCNIFSFQMVTAKLEAEERDFHWRGWISVGKCAKVERRRISLSTWLMSRHHPLLQIECWTSASASLCIWWWPSTLLVLPMNKVFPFKPHVRTLQWHQEFISWIAPCSVNCQSNSQIEFLLESVVE